MEIDIADLEYGNKTKLLNNLCEVVDPELGINIVDLGMVYGTDLNEKEKTISITMTLSTPSCPMGNIITNNAKLITEQHFPNYTVNIHLTFDPRWSFEKITQAGRTLLGW